MWFTSSGARNMNFIRKMQRKYDFSVKGIGRWIEKKKLDQELFEQRYNLLILKIDFQTNLVDWFLRYFPARQQFLGPDLAAAHFIVFRGGSVRFEGGTKWIKDYDDEQNGLPNKRVKGLHLEAIDASGMNLYHVALSNMTYLSNLKWLSLADNPNVDDWFLDSVTGEYETLEYLDISGCKKVTDRGIAILSRLSKLKELRVENVTDTIELRLACLSLEEYLPRLVVKGIDHSLPLAEEAQWKFVK
jgi:hypothetical protein